MSICWSLPLLFSCDRLPPFHLFYYERSLFSGIGNAGSSVKNPWDFHSVVDYCPQPDPVLRISFEIESIRYTNSLSSLNRIYLLIIQTMVQHISSKLAGEKQHYLRLLSSLSLSPRIATPAYSHISRLGTTPWSPISSRVHSTSAKQRIKRISSENKLIAHHMIRSIAHPQSQLTWTWDSGQAVKTLRAG